jgi:hypothetical protein
MDFVFFYLIVTAWTWLGRQYMLTSEDDRRDYFRNGFAEFIRCLGWPLMLINHKEKTK